MQASHAVLVAAKIIVKDRIPPDESIMRAYHEVGVARRHFTGAHFVEV